jgi:excisionase family DNA binding protein
MGDLAPEYTLSTGDIAKRWKISRRTVERLAKSGRLPCAKIRGRYWFNLEAVQEAVRIRPPQ